MRACLLPNADVIALTRATDRQLEGRGRVRRVVQARTAAYDPQDAPGAWGPVVVLIERATGRDAGRDPPRARRVAEHPGRGRAPAGGMPWLGDGEQYGFEGGYAADVYVFARQAGWETRLLTYAFVY